MHQMHDNRMRLFYAEPVPMPLVYEDMFATYDGNGGEKIQVILSS